nr:hypothetical protein CFP56_19359 [Quercus suber]
MRCHENGRVAASKYCVGKLRPQTCLALAWKRARPSHCEKVSAALPYELGIGRDHALDPLHHLVSPLRPRPLPVSLAHSRPWGPGHRAYSTSRHSLIQRTSPHPLVPGKPSFDPSAPLDPRPGQAFQLCHAAPGSWSLTGDASRVFGGRQALRGKRDDSGPSIVAESTRLHDRPGGRLHQRPQRCGPNLLTVTGLCALQLLTKLLICSHARLSLRSSDLPTACSTAYCTPTDVEYRLVTLQT